MNPLSAPLSQSSCETKRWIETTQAWIPGAAFGVSSAPVATSPSTRTVPTACPVPRTTSESPPSNHAACRRPSEPLRTAPSAPRAQRATVLHQPNKIVRLAPSPRTLPVSFRPSYESTRKQRVDSPCSPERFAHQTSEELTASRDLKLAEDGARLVRDGTGR